MLDILKVHVLQHLAGECFYKQLIMALSGLDFCYQIFSRLMLPWRTIKLNRVVSVSGRAKDRAELISVFNVPVQRVRRLICCLFTVRSNSPSTNTSWKTFDFSEGFWESEQNVYKKMSIGLLLSGAGIWWFSTAEMILCRFPELKLFYTLKKNGSKQYQIKVLRLVTIAEPVLLLNRTLFIRLYKEPCFESAIGPW